MIDHPVHHRLVRLKHLNIFVNRLPLLISDQIVVKTDKIDLKEHPGLLANIIKITFAIINAVLAKRLPLANDRALAAFLKDPHHSLPHNVKEITLSVFLINNIVFLDRDLLDQGEHLTDGPRVHRLQNGHCVQKIHDFFAFFLKFGLEHFAESMDGDLRQRSDSERH